MVADDEAGFELPEGVFNLVTGPAVGVTLGGIREIAKAWKPILAKGSLTVGLTGVFCQEYLPVGTNKAASST